MTINHNTGRKETDAWGEEGGEEGGRGGREGRGGKRLGIKEGN